MIAVAIVGVLVWWAYPAAFSPWRAAGIVTGWIGSGLLIASLLLMVREPWLARWLGGLETMYRWHHLLGVWAYVLLLAHPLAFGADGWAESPAVAWASLAPWHQGWPVWLGWASLLGMMGGLAVALWPPSSYALWRKLHHLLSLSVVFGAAHLVSLGLGGLLLVVPVLIIAFLLWRMVRADHGLGAQPYIVQRVEHLSPTTVEVTLHPLAKKLNTQPGQFVLAAFFAGPRYRGCGEFHPYTISAIHSGGDMALGIKALGDCTRQLQSIQTGVESRLQGPFGEFLADVSGSSLWLAGGIGITPFIAALRNGPLTHAVKLIYLHREGAGAPYTQALHELAARQPLLDLRVEDTGEVLPNLDTLLPAAEELGGLECFLCGPSPLIDAASRLLQTRGVPSTRIHFERFDFR